MAHQLDFHVTLWSDDSDALLMLEKRLLQLENAEQSADVLLSLAALLRLNANAGDIIKTDVHSTDINWDDDVPLSDEAAQFEYDLTDKGMPQLTEVEFKQLYQGDWSEFDKAEAERIQKLLDDADKQSDWGKTLSDYGEFL